MNKYDDLIAEGVSDLVIEAFDNYWNHGFEPGSFLRAVICNDLVESVSRADPWNSKNLSKIVAYMINNAPIDSWGSYEVYKEWINKGAAFKAIRRLE